jgi:hypothetical protein
MIHNVIQLGLNFMNPVATWPTDSLLFHAFTLVVTHVEIIHWCSNDYVAVINRNFQLT